MATKWDALWDDEDWWKKQSRTALYVIYRDIQNEEDKLKFRNKMMLSSVDADKSIWTAYDLLSFVQVAEEAGFQYTTDVDETKDIRREDIEALAVTRLQALEKNSEKNLSYYLRAKALKEVISKTTSSDDNDRDILKTSIYTDTKKIEEQLPQTEPDIEQATEFRAADDSGALDGVSDEIKQAFIRKIEQTFGWNLINAEQVKANDAHLNSNIDLSVEINDDAGNKITNQIYCGCDNIPLPFSYPEGFSDEKKQQFAYMYKNQLLANAAQRATMELMKNPKLISEAQTKEELVTKFADVVKQKYQHSVVMAALFSNEDLGKKIQFNKSMQLVADDTTDDDIQNILSKLENDEIKLDSDAIAMDTTALKWEIENAERIMKTKHIDVDALPFWKKATGAVNNWFNHITKRGGWKNLSVNVLANGGAYIGATILIGKGAAAVVAAGVSTPAVALLAGGYALYAGWSYVSAKKMPAINKLISEANQQQLGFKDTIKHIRKNYSRAKKEIQAEAEFKSRSNFRVGEGVIGGAATTAGAFAGNPLIRIITSSAAKTVLLGKSIFNRNQSKENLQKNVNKSNLNAFKTAENYVTQDKVSLGAIIAGTAIARGVFGDATPSSDTIGQEQQVNVEAEGFQPDSLRSQLDSLGGKGTPLDRLRAQLDSLGGEGTSLDSLRAQLDSLGGQEQPDSLGVAVQQTDGMPVDNSAVDGGNPVAEGGNPAKFTPHTDEKTGMTVWQEAKTKGGVTETYLQDAKGNNFVRYEGLNTNHVVSEASYAKLIDTINSKGNTNFVMEDGSKYTFQEAVEMMREKLNANPDRLPEGIGTNRAIYLAMMRARYTGKLDIINDIKCNDNELTALVAESQKYATNPGHIGRLITERPLPTRVGPASAITDPCVPVNNLGVNEAPDAEILSAENDVNKSNITTEKVDMAAPYTEVKTTFDGNKGDYPVNQESVNGEYEKTFKKDGSVWIDDKDGITTTTGLESNNREVHYHAPVDATPIINNLPNVPTSTETVDGVTTMTYAFQSGKTVQVVLDPLKEGAEARTGHFLIDGKEYIIDANSSKALGEKISAPLDGGLQYRMVDGTEQDVSQHLTDNVKDLNKGIDKLNEHIESIANKQKGAIAGQDISVEEYNAGYTETGTENVTLTPEQTAEIRSKGEFVCTGIKDGKAIMTVTGVEGVDRISVVAPTHVNMAGASDAVVDIKDKVYTATITTQGGQNLVVSIDDNIDPSTNLPKGTSITYDGKPVVLDSKTATDVEKSVENAFAANNVNVDVKAHTPFTDKIVKACEGFTQKVAAAAKSQVVEK